MSVRPDADEIFRLIKTRDRAGAHGAVTRFARRIGRHPQTFWNLRSGKQVSPTLLNAIAAALKVPASAITLPDDAAETEAPQPQAEAA